MPSKEEFIQSMDFFEADVYEHIFRKGLKRFIQEGMDPDNELAELYAGKWILSMRNEGLGIEGIEKRKKLTVWLNESINKKKQLQETIQ